MCYAGYGSLPAVGKICPQSQYKRGVIYTQKYPINFWRLFTACFQLSAFTFGGGYVIVPLMRKQFVDKLGWLDEHAMLDFTAIAQSTPGAMAVNASVLVGYHLLGLPGALVAIAGTVLPPLILLSLISLGYQAFIGSALVRAVLRGMEAGVCAVIVDVVASMGTAIIRRRSIYLLLIMVGAFIAASVLQVNVMLIIGVCALLGLVTTLLGKGKEADHDLS